MQPPLDLSNLPLLGKGAPIIDKRTLKMAKYIPAGLGVPPPACEWQKKVSSWTMSLNNVLGDCVCAAGAHAVAQWTTYAQPKPFVPTDASVLKTYEDVGGYIPGNASTDKGCFVLNYLKYLRKTGIAGHKIAAFVQVDPTNDFEVRWSIKLFGNVILGVQLPRSAAGQNSWQVPITGPTGNGSPGSWGGHAIPIVAYNNGVGGSREWVVTWGGLLPMSPPFRRIYADEAWCCLSEDWINGRGVSPGAFDFDTLNADLWKLNVPKAKLKLQPNFD